MDDIPRQEKQTNAEGFTKAQLARRKYEIKLLAERYPNLPPTWLDMVWNHVERTPKEEIERVIATGAWEGPPKKPHVMGGVVKDGVHVEDPTD